MTLQRPSARPRQPVEGRRRRLGCRSPPRPYCAARGRCFAAWLRGGWTALTPSSSRPSSGGASPGPQQHCAATYHVGRQKDGSGPHEHTRRGGARPGRRAAHDEVRGRSPPERAADRVEPCSLDGERLRASSTFCMAGLGFDTCTACGPEDAAARRVQEGKTYDAWGRIGSHPGRRGRRARRHRVAGRSSSWRTCVRRADGAQQHGQSRRRTQSASVEELPRSRADKRRPEHGVFSSKRSSSRHGTDTQKVHIDEEHLRARQMMGARVGSTTPRPQGRSQVADERRRNNGRRTQLDEMSPARQRQGVRRASLNSRPRSPSMTLVDEADDPSARARTGPRGEPRRRSSRRPAARPAWKDHEQGPGRTVPAPQDSEKSHRSEKRAGCGRGASCGPARSPSGTRKMSPRVADLVAIVIVPAAAQVADPDSSRCREQLGLRRRMIRRREPGSTSTTGRRPAWPYRER